VCSEATRTRETETAEVRCDQMAACSGFHASGSTAIRGGPVRSALDVGAPARKADRLTGLLVPSC
jgi:hypothetical protein